MPQHMLPFVLAATDQGTLIVNRLDQYYDPERGYSYGVGYELLETANYDAPDRDMVVKFLQLRRLKYGDGVLAVDCGANIGAHTVAWAKDMVGWGNILAIEAQEWSYYALCGNLALNNCLNAKALHAAIGSYEGVLRIPFLNQCAPCNYGGLELAPPEGHPPQVIGQEVERSHDKMYDVRMITIDSLNLPRLDFLKVDVEGMELDVMRGARETILRCRPLLMIEITKARDESLIHEIFAMGYPKLYHFGMNAVAVHPDDPCKDHIVFHTVGEEPPRC